MSCKQLNQNNHAAAALRMICLDVNAEWHCRKRTSKWQRLTRVCLCIYNLFLTRYCSNRSVKTITITVLNIQMNAILINHMMFSSKSACHTTVAHKCWLSNHVTCKEVLSAFHEDWCWFAVQQFCAYLECFFFHPSKTFTLEKKITVRGYFVLCYKPLDVESWLFYTYIEMYYENWKLLRAHTLHISIDLSIFFSYPWIGSAWSYMAPRPSRLDEKCWPPPAFKMPIPVLHPQKSARHCRTSLTSCVCNLHLKMKVDDSPRREYGFKF